MTGQLATAQAFRCRVGLHKWVRTEERDTTLDNPGQYVEFTTRCRLCGRERRSGTLIATILFAGFAVAAVVVFYVVSPFLGAVLMVGAVSGLAWAMGPAIIERVARWLGR